MAVGVLVWRGFRPTLLCLMSRAELLQLPENTAGEVPFQDAFDLSVAESFVRASGHVFLALLTHPWVKSGPGVPVCGHRG